MPDQDEKFPDSAKSVDYNSLRFCWHVDRTVAGSARPGRYGDLRRDFEKLKNEGVSLIVNLCSEPLSLPEEMNGAFEVVHEPILDGHPPEPEQLERLIEVVRAARSSGKRTVVHCRGGVGRTATVLIPMMIEFEDLPLEEAIQRLRRAGRYTQSMNQWDFLKQWVESRARPKPGPGRT